MPPSSDAIERVIRYPSRHLRVLGPPGSGKTSLLIERYKTLTAVSQPAPVFIITYSREQLRRMTEVVIGDGVAHAGPPPVLTHFMAAREVITASGAESPRMVEGLEEALLVERVVNRNEKKLKSDYRHICRSERFQRELLDFFHLLQQNGITDDPLQQLVKETKTASCADVLLLYHEFVNVLEAEGGATFYDISWKAAAACTHLADDHVFRRAAVILIDDFQDVDAGQFAFLEKLTPPDGNTAVNVFGDPLGAYFAARGTDPRFLNSEFSKLYGGDTVHLTRRCHAASVLGPTLDALASEVLGDGAREFVPQDEAPATSWGPLFEDKAAAPRGVAELTVVEDEVAEVYEAAAIVHDAVVAGRSPAQIAVVTNDKPRYEAMLRAAFAQRGVPLDSGRPAHSTFRAFVHVLLKLVQSQQDDVALQALVTSPFFPHFRSECLATDVRADLEPYRLHDIARKYVRVEGAAMRSKEPAEWMRYILRRCVLPACAVYREQSGDESVYGFLSALEERWVEYASAANASGAPVDIAAFVRKSGLFSTRLAAPVPTALEVGYYSCREIKSRSFPVVIVLGCSEMLFPSVARRDTVLPAVALQRLFDRALPGNGVRVHAARTPEEHLADEHHLLYHSFTRATEALYILSPQKFAGQEYPAPATLVADTFGGDALTGARAAATRVPPSVRFAKSWVGRGARTRADERLAALSPMGRLWHESGRDPARFTVPVFPISKSSLESYVKCPRRFFYTKVLRVKEDESGALKVGKIFHEVVADLAEPFRTKRELHAAATEDKIRDTIERRLEGDRTAHADSLFGASLRFYLYYMVRSALRHDRETTDDYEIAGVESKLDFEHGGFAFTGRADVVEASPPGSVLLDYKTGEFKKTGDNLRTRTLETLERPERANWQVPIYVWGHRAGSQEFPAAFKHIVQGPGEDPFDVTLHICESEEAVPAVARSRKRDHQGHSYLLRKEIEAIIERAATFAGEIFGERAGFERTDDLSQCRMCTFNRLCERRVE